MFNLVNKVAIVTGASRGIGKAIAGAVAQAGAHVVCVSRSENELPKRRYRVVAKSPGRFVDVKR